jgi:ankyrin repeat protein
MYAAWNGYADILQVFLDKGADAHARDRNGATALYYAKDPIAKFTRKEERLRIEQMLTDARAKM